MKTPCEGNNCYYGYETIMNQEVGSIKGGYRLFIEIMAFLIFVHGVVLNTAQLTFMISAHPNLDSFDGLLINLSFGQLVASFGLAFMFFVEFTTSLAPIGNGGCKFIQWLNVTSVTITGIAVIALVYDLHRRVYYGNISKSMSRKKTFFIILVTWLLASVPGIPYFITGKMGTNGLCENKLWSNDAEIFYISILFVFQILLPLVTLMFAFVRIFIALRSPREGDTELVDETAPGSEASYQRGVFKRKVVMVAYIALFYYMILVCFSILSFALSLNVDNIEQNIMKHARIRELNSIFECLTCVVVPLCCFSYYDKLKLQVRKMCCCFRNINQELYNSLNLRYNVYQQTVHETEENLEEHHPETSNRMSGIPDDIHETERDDVAIIDNEA